MIQYIIRIVEFDASHRVMNERMKCFNNHGHRYTAHLTFSFNHIEEIGYAIDFKEIKRVGHQWIDDMLDHAAIHNPKDKDFIEPCLKYNTKLWLMSLNGEGEYCNPSVENIAKEIFLAMDTLFESYENLKIDEIIMYETPNCYTKCTLNSISHLEVTNWKLANYNKVKKYAEEKGIVEYDDRKVK